MDAKSYFGDLAEDYLDYYNSEGMRWVMHSEQNIVVTNIPDIHSRPDVLEIGTGPGRLSSVVLKKGVTFTGVDIAEEMVNVCRKRIGPEPRLLHLDVQNGLPFPDNSFDYIYSLRVLKYIHLLPQVLSEVHRVLRPNGIFLFNMPNTRSVSVLHHVQQVKNHQYSIESLRSLLEEKGLDVVKVLSGPKLPDFIYQSDNKMLFKATISIESGLEKVFTYRLTREPFYICKKVG